MLPCEMCRDQLLDYLYDLLDEADRAECAAHLRACPACEAELAAARSQQSILKHAARAIPNVPEFRLPTDAPAEIPVAVHDTQPASSLPPAPRRSLWSRPWVAWTAAAAILVTVTAGVSYYNYSLAEHQRTVNLAQQNLQIIDQTYRSLPARVAVLQHTTTSNVRSKIAPHVHVVGPTTFQPNAKGHLQISTRSAEGTLAAADLRVKLIDEKTGQANVLQMFHAKTDAKGPVRVEIDPSLAKADSKLKIVVEARTGESTATIEQAVRYATSTYVARIDTNKAVYAIPDVLFCRVLILDRYGLQPPTHAIPLHVDLVNPTGKIVRSIEAHTGAGGIVTAEFTLEEDYPAGSYALKIRPSEPARDHVQVATSNIDVLRDLNTPAIQFDLEHFLPGELAGGYLRAMQNGLPSNVQVQLGKAAPMALAIQPFQEQALRPSMSAPAAGGGGGGIGGKGALQKNQADASGQSVTGRFAIPVPKNVPPGVSRLPIEFQFGAGKEKRVIKGELPIAPTDFAVDFFPEGGDLIAKVENRVFYRVRSQSGQPVHGEGSLIVMHDAGVIDSHYSNGLGYFDFVPNPKENYTVRVTTPVKVEEIRQPFAKLPIQSQGLALHVPSAVGQQGDPIHVVLRHQGVERKLLIAAECRGQVVDQRWIDIKPGQTEVTLQPTAEAFGMIRVTAYELANLKLKPLAERLVFRGSSQRLDIRATLSTQQFQEGRRVRAKIEALDEKGQPAAAYLLACAVDDRFQNRPRGLAAHFQIFNEVRTGADLEDAVLVVSDSPESVQALERFLGTHGWRRWKHEPTTQAVTNAAEPAIIFSIENAPLAELANRYETALIAALTPIHQNAFKEKIDLENKRDHAVAFVNRASSELSLFEANVRERIAIALGAAVVACLTLSLILMAIGMIRIVRTHRSATTLFGTAFGSLAACLILVVVGRSYVSLGMRDAPMAGAAMPFMDIGEKLNHALEMPGHKAVRGGNLVGVFAMAAPEKHDQQLAQKTASQEQAKVYANALNLSKALVMRDRADGAALADQKQEKQRFGGNVQWIDRLNRARGAVREMEMGKGDEKKGNEPKAKGSVEKTPPVASVQPAKTPNAVEARRRSPEFAYEHSPDLAFDTLLWHPSLWLPDGRGEVRFDLAAGQASYRLLILGHGPTGRFGYFEKHLDVPAAGR